MGLTHSTPLTATIVSLAARTVTLGAAVVFTGGIPNFAYLALAVFVFLGVLQSATSLLTFIGLQKIGTSRSQPLRNSYPLWSAGLAIAVMHEQASLAVLAGTVLVVIGLVLILWKPEPRCQATAGGMCSIRWPLVFSPELLFRCDATA